MDWKELYKSKLTTAEAAVKKIKSGDRLVFGHAAGEPFPLVEALVKRAKELSNVEIVHMVSLGKGEHTKPDMAGHLRYNSIFASACTREAINEGRADYTPIFFSEVPGLFKNDVLPVNAALITVSPPDKHGYMSYGVSVDYTMAAAEKADFVIAEVNEKMPRTYPSMIHVSRVDAIVETNRPLPVLKPAEITDVEKGIGENIAHLITDGSNLQLGIGGIPDAVLMFLKHKNDLGIHSEMFSDGVVDLVESGVVTSKFNNLFPDKLTATFLMGTEKLYNFVDDNQMVNMHPVDFTNDPYIAGQVNKLVSINAAIQVDVFGQVCSQAMGNSIFSAVGGQVDFVRGASRSKGGKSIIALPSTAKNGTISRIVPSHGEGNFITTSFNDVRYVATEYGIAELAGKTLKQRAEALISIAHPDFRAELRTETIKKRGKLFSI
jgi:4-hydroxybutyrate CoA-transferase